jgi:hypothetical protein
MLAELHLAEEAFALHLFLQGPQGLIDIVVADENLHVVFLFDSRLIRPTAKRLGPMAYADGTQPVSTSESLPISTAAANWKTRDFGTSPWPFEHATACPYNELPRSRITRPEVGAIDRAAYGGALSRQSTKPQGFG